MEVVCDRLQPALAVTANKLVLLLLVAPPRNGPTAAAAAAAAAAASTGSVPHCQVQRH
jgi:hypothetical protein